MAVVTMKSLLEAGVHFGHQTKRWNPKMGKYIYAARNDIHIIDLQISVGLIEEAYAFIRDIAKSGKDILFVGTKKQAQEVSIEEALRSNSYYVTERWLGGTLTNFRTIRRRVKRLEQIEKMEKDGTFDRLPKKEVVKIKKEYDKLNKLLCGIRDMHKLPQAMFIVDPSKEDIAIKEARKLNIPFIQTVHTIYEEAVDYVTKGHFSTLSKKVVTKYISNFYNKNVNEIIVPSKRVYNILKNKYKIKTPINIVPNGTNLEKFKKENKKEITKLKTKYNLTNCFVILFVGRLGYEKNISFLIEAHKKIVAKNKHAKLLIVGEGPDHNILLELTKELNLEENVIFTGKVDYEEVTNYYHLADILVTASKCETQGLTIIEALASSTVVCTIKKEVFLSVIKHQKNGILFKNKLDYVYHINHLIKSKEKLNNMKKNTVSSVKEYSLEYYAKSIIKVYKKALKNKNINKNNDCPK